MIAKTTPPADADGELQEQLAAILTGIYEVLETENTGVGLTYFLENMSFDKRLLALIQTETAKAALEARLDGMQQAKSRVLRRTEIPRDARNPTRDATVILGEQIADIIQGDIDALKQGPTNAK